MRGEDDMSTLLQQVLEVIKWERNTLDASFLSHWFTEFSKGEPWNEYLMCSQCKDTDDYGPVHTYGFEEVTVKEMKKCPGCGGELQLFWNTDRVMNYLFKNHESDGRVVLHNNEIASWWMGYPISQNCFYIDVAVVLPNFRIKPGFRVFLKEFRKFLEEKRQGGFHRFKTKTHIKAVNVRMIFRWLGFHEDGPSEEDADRTYWVLD